MKRIYLIAALIIMSMVFVSCSSKAKVSTDTAAKVQAVKSNITEEQMLKSGSEDSNYVELYKVKDNVWVHTTYIDINGNRTPSNGLVIETSNSLILIDTPWNDAQTKELIKLTKSKFNKDFSYAFITHAHQDRMGGISTLLENKIYTTSTPLTARLAEKYGYEKPQPESSLNYYDCWNTQIEEVSIEVFYPGEGHSADNIVVWLPQYKVLFGGCLIKSLDSKSLGNIGDANIGQWPVSVQNVLDKYPDAHIVIPGHGKWGGTELAKHTIELLIKNQGKKNGFTVFIKKTNKPDILAGAGDVENNELWARYSDGKEELLVASRDAEKAKDKIAGISNLQLSPDISKVYFASAAWVTSHSIHVYDFKTKSEKYVCPGDLLKVIQKGKYKGKLLVYQHRYNDNGAYDHYYIVDENGKDIKDLGEDLPKDF